VPNIYGMKNVKWLTDIKVETFDFKGYWQEQGWDDVAIVNTNTRIDVPGRTIRWDGGEVPVAGIAFAGSRGIKQVEASFDEGKTWQAAALEASPGGRLSWVRWVVRWTPRAAGAATILARATDGNGDVQTPLERDPYPTGATGYAVLPINVVKV
jgi:DMSO/TMAO reductase YedYZ molybdopterin-dependent catalytic subunit